MINSFVPLLRKKLIVINSRMINGPWYDPCLLRFPVFVGTGPGRSTCLLKGVVCTTFCTLVSYTSLSYPIDTYGLEQSLTEMFFCKPGREVL